MRRILLSALVLLGGCQAILGIDDTQSAGDDAPLVDAAVPGVDAPDGTPDDPDAGVEPSFELGALPLRFNVPLDGINELAVSIARTGGFDGDVTVSVADITGLTAPDIVLSGTETQGVMRLSLSASSGLDLGDTFDFVVQATSGAIADEGTVEGEVVGAPGTLEPAFGTAGVVNDIRGTGSGDDCPMNRVMEMSDGDVVAVGTDVGGLGAQQIVTVRLQPNGARRTTFSGDGMTVEPVTSGFGEAHGFDVAQHDVSKIMVIGDITTGTDDDDVVLLQYAANGSHDVLFGSPFPDNLGGNEGGRALALAADDTFAVGGVADGGALVARYNAAAGRISGFGTNGVATFDVPGNGDEVVALSFAAAKILAVVTSGGTGGGIRVLRIENDGTVDSTYGPAFVPGAVAKDAAFATGGVVFAAAECGGAPCVAKFGPGGSLDPSFGTDGVATLDFSTGDEQVEAIALLADGKLVVAGNVGGDPWLIRLRPNGTIDDTFDSNGPSDGRGGGVVVPPLGFGGSIRDVTQAANGDLLMCGTGASGGNNSGLVARMRN